MIRNQESNPQPLGYQRGRIIWEAQGVYDLTGRRITTLASREFWTGSHSLTWNGHDVQGRAMSSGNYIVRLETGSGVEARKMMLIR